MVEAEIDNTLYLARVSNISNLPEETLKYAEKIIKLREGNINEEEKNLLFNTLNKLINFKRNTWRTVNALETKEKINKSSLLPKITELKQTLAEEMKIYIYKGIDYIDTSLFKNAKNNETKAMYSKIKGDYLRYIIEIAPSEKEEELNDIKQKIDNCYKVGISLCNDFNNLNITKLGLMINYTVFLFEIMKDYKNAYMVATDIYQKTNKSLSDDKSAISKMREIDKLLNALKDNLSKWSEKVIQEKVDTVENDVSSNQKVSIPSS